MDFKIGDIIEDEIIDFTHEGNGVLKIDNFTIFVKDALIGDIVKIKIEILKKNYAIASVVDLIKPSNDRVELDFDLKESKGGIPLIEYDYDKQLQWKKDKVQKDLEKIGGIDDVVVNDTIGMGNPYRYRNHVQIPVGLKDAKTVLGFYQPNSNEIVDMEASILQPELGDRLLKIIRRWIEQYNIKPYDRRRKKGILRHIGMRFNRDNQAMIILVTATDNLPKKNERKSHLKNKQIGFKIEEKTKKLDKKV